MGKQEPVGGDPTEGPQHEQSPGHEIGRWHGSDLGGQGRAQAFGLPAEAARPKLAALVGHAGLRSGY
ncbi:MAG: hypothetical protein WCD04_15815, partial [Terriglobia bacterium]